MLECLERVICILINVMEVKRYIEKYCERLQYTSRKKNINQKSQLLDYAIARTKYNSEKGCISHAVKYYCKRISSSAKIEICIGFTVGINGGKNICTIFF